ncbi:hypothetical protein CBR_g70706 [Chara braunii]|uniref:DUF1764 domain-containing protein n=1 Tax=Chara braunii TaxID=69332 RepID=A0A388K9U6_CHABU|nr:hypothetical protein CBR_g70706 [Chara braunii]|eukprot:GBG66828.1 hypothetical protein CBR_g70706 [Chara braunii]
MGAKTDDTAGSLPVQKVTKTESECCNTAAKVPAPVKAAAPKKLKRKKAVSDVDERAAIGTASEPAENDGAASQPPAKDEIDAIFAEAKQKKKKPGNEGENNLKKNSTAGVCDEKLSEKPTDVPPMCALDYSGRKKKKVKKGQAFSAANVLEDATVNRKRTEEGYRVYTEDELRVSRKQAGGTPLCPFDCDCCF